VPAEASGTKKGGEMSIRTAAARRTLEGHCVNVALRDGRRIDGCELVSSDARRVTTLWLLIDGSDVFVAGDEVVAIEESSSAGPVAA
jgi:hypothetical protein